MSTGEGHRIGVDTGGTFTDLVLVGPEGHIVETHKRLSTPDNPSRAVLEGIDALLAEHGQGLTRRDVAVTHGSTVATNALLEAKHGQTVFVTTAGFEDTLHLARQHRPDLYELVPRRPDPPVPRERCVGVVERIGHDGRIITELTDEALNAAVDRVVTLKPDAVAVSLLHSYANPAHEQRLAEALRERLGDDVHLTLSHELMPVFREYERASACVINAAVAPRMTRYLRKLEQGLDGASLQIMGSHGGTMSVEDVCRQPVRTILSGPAGGVLGAAAVGEKLITLDMGGTSTDVALIEGEPTRSTDHEAAGLPVKLPMVDIHTVGAGGGSVAWVDAGGALRVGPRSAGADPGPACYGRQRGLLEGGGINAWWPTVTDANVVLGHLDPTMTLGSGLKLDAEASRSAIAQLADQTRLTEVEAAEGVLRVVEVNMARAVHRISLQRGRDPRDYALVPFGGAGGLHACRLAEQLGMTRVLLPVEPGLLSAIGMLTAPPRSMKTWSILRHLADPELRDILAQMLHGTISNESSGFDGRTEFNFDLRYAGQSHEINITLPNAVTTDHIGIDLKSFVPALNERFAQEHERLNGYRLDDQPVELVAVHAVVDGPSINVHTRGDSPAETPTPQARRNTGAERVPRRSVEIGKTYPGPFVIDETSATTVVPEGWALSVRPDGVLEIKREQPR